MTKIEEKHEKRDINTERLRCREQGTCNWHKGDEETRNRQIKKLRQDKVRR